jgi:hypothetical protein
MLRYLCLSLPTNQGNSPAAESLIDEILEELLRLFDCGYIKMPATSEAEQEGVIQLLAAQFESEVEGESYLVNLEGGIRAILEQWKILAERIRDCIPEYTRSGPACFMRPASISDPDQTCFEGRMKLCANNRLAPWHSRFDGRAWD